MTTTTRHHEIVAAYKEHGYTKAAELVGVNSRTVYRHANGWECNCLRQHQYGSAPCPSPSSPPCLYGCPLTLAGHEVATPSAGTYHETVWKRQVRAEAEHIDGQGGTWHALAKGSRIWVAE